MEQQEVVRHTGPQYTETHGAQLKTQRETDPTDDTYIHVGKVYSSAYYNYTLSRNAANRERTIHVLKMHLRSKNAPVKAEAPHKVDLDYTVFDREKENPV